MATVSRSASITYGSVTVGGGSSTLLRGNIGLDGDYDSRTLVFNAVVRAASSGAFATAVNNFEAEFSKPRQDLNITFGSIDVDYSESNNTAFNIQPTWRKVQGSDVNTGLSREYTVSITFGLPANLTGEDHLRDLNVSVDATGSEVRTIKIDGTYTAVASGNDAVAQYEAEISDLITAISEAVDNSVEWDELVPTQYVRDNKDFVVGFSVILRERVLDLTGTLIDPSTAPEIKNIRFAAATRQVGPGDALLTTKRPIEVVCQFSCDVKKSETTDLKGTYQQKIFRWLKTRAELAADGVSMGVLANNVNFDYQENRIEARVEFLVNSQGNLIRSSITSRDAEKKGIALVGVHDENPHAAYIMPAFGSYVRETTVSVTIIGNKAAAQALALQMLPAPSTIGGQVGRSAGIFNTGAGAISRNSVPDFGASGGSFVQLERDEIGGESVLGLDGTTRITEYAETVVSRYVADPVTPRPLI